MASFPGRQHRSDRSGLANDHGRAYPAAGSWRGERAITESE